MTDEATTPPARGKRSLAIVAGLIVVIVIGLGLWLASRPAPEQLQGMVDADEVNVGTKALARVDRLIAEEGQRVQPGSLLATLSSPRSRAGRRRRKGRSTRRAPSPPKPTRVPGRRISRRCARRGRRRRRRRIWRR